MDEVTKLACGAVVTPLRRINHPKGDVFHGLQAGETCFKGFGEAYFSSVYPGVTKGWKRHREMTLNLIVPVGTIEFYLHLEGRKNSETVRLGDAHYARLTVPPGVWMAFCGIGEGLNLLLNIASIPHDPEEAVHAPLEQFPLLSSGCVPR